jgi:ATP-dependent DNA ligase
VAVRAKWEGFRYFLARHGDGVAMYSKSGLDLSRYFPELVAAGLTLREKTLSSTAKSAFRSAVNFPSTTFCNDTPRRVKKLAERIPALFLAFDLLKQGKMELAGEPTAILRRSRHSLAVPANDIRFQA